MKKKDFQKFVKRNTHKRRSKEAARRELHSLLPEGVGADSLKLGSVEDKGRGGRVSPKRGRGELECEGVYSSTRSGFGFVSPREGGRDIFIPEGRSNGALDGDLVSIVYHFYTDGRGEERTEGRVVKVVSIGRRSLIGTVEETYIGYGRRRARALRLLPDDRGFFPFPIIIDKKGAEVGDKVEVKLIRGGYELGAEVSEVFGRCDSREANYGAILRESGIECDFSEAEEAEALRVAAEPISGEGRVRFSREPIFTMDGADALDLDDAVSLSRSPDGWRLGVHIADVSHYVRPKSALDRAAMARATSVYFTDKVVPMLPRVLSNGACSLNAGEDKYAISAIISLSAEGEIRSLRLSESVIRSEVRGVYSEINSLLSGEADAQTKEKYKRVLPSLGRMEELYGILRARRVARSYIDFDSDEAKILLDQQGEPVDVVLRERGTAERMIEEFMLTANEAVASYLRERNIPLVYRIHEPPPPEKYRELLEFVHNLGFDISGINPDEPSAKQLASLLESAKEGELFYPVSYMMLRSMSKAKYSEIHASHFGLGIENYCHFTSPIRRLSDLATHRIIKAHLHGEPTEKYRSYAKRAAAAATDGELRAMNAERRIEELYKVIYLSRFIGESFIGAVSSITSFGMFVRLPNTVEGLVPIEYLGGEYFFDEKNISLVSRKHIYRLSDTVKIRVAECDISRARALFEIDTEGEES